jgi:adenylate kinase family enzyme
MKQITCVFFGRSGSGKGTQADLLIKKLKEIDEKSGVIYVETGAELRKMKNNGSYTANLTKEVMDHGKLMPASIPIWAWSNLLMSEVKTGEEHMVFDGVARRADEAPILSQALEFYKWFETDVRPSVNFFRSCESCRYIKINGHQSIEDVHKDILKALGI